MKASFWECGVWEGREADGLTKLQNRKQQNNFSACPGRDFPEITVFWMV